MLQLKFSWQYNGINILYIYKTRHLHISITNFRLRGLKAMSGYIESTRYIEYTDKMSQQTTPVNTNHNATSSIQIFNANLPKTQPSNLEIQETVSRTQTRKLDISELSDKYEDNPIAVLSELGIQFTDKQIAELEKSLKDKKHLQAFLTIVDKANLNPDDIMAAVKKSKEFKSSNIFKRGWNVIKTAFTDGVSEAWELAKSERVYYTQQLSTNMSEIREEREDFSSEGLADVADVCVQQPEIADETMHFVTVKSEPGKHAYTEEDVLSAAEFMSEKPHEAETFLANAQELESIKDENGKMKYQGSTIIKVDKRMVNNKELQPTMMKTAHKSDMTDEYLDNITYNLEQNPEMQCAIDYSLDAKNADGTDRFSAGSINSESNHLVDKNGDYCKSYTQNLQDLSGYSNLDSEDIVTIASNITSHPEIKNEVIKQIENGTMSGKEIADYSNSLAQSNQTTESSTSTNNQINATSNTTSGYKADEESIDSSEQSNTLNKEILEKATTPVIKEFLQQNNASEESIDTIETITDYESDGNISKVNYKRIYNFFGTMTDAILARIKKDPSFIDVIKEYNGNRIILQAMLENPELLNKIKAAGGNLSTSQLSSAIEACSDSSSTKVMIASLETGSVNSALKTTKRSKITNTKQDALEILLSTKSNSNKRNELEQLYGVGSNREFIC